MNTVQRTRGIRKLARRIVCRGAARSYVTAGDQACGKLMREARALRHGPGPSDSAILARAMSDLAREIRSGFWEAKAACF